MESSVTLIASGYILLFSGLMSFIYLLKQNAMKCIKTSLHLLTGSDILSCIFLAAILFTNYWNMTTDNSHSVLQNAINTTWNISELISDVNTTIDSRKEWIREGPVCDFKDIFMQYATFLVPLENAFVSLFSFSLYFIVNSTLIRKKLSQALTQDQGNNIQQVDDTKTTMKHDWKHDTMSNDKNATRRALKTNLSKFVNKKTVTGLSVISQWLIPLLSVTMLNLAEYEHINMRDLKSANCIFTANSLFEECNFEKYQSEDTSNSTNDNLLITFHADSIVIDKVISNVHNIIKSILNNTKSNFTSTTNAVNFEEISITSTEREIDLLLPPLHEEVLDLPNFSLNNDATEMAESAHDYLIEKLFLRNASNKVPLSHEQIYTDIIKRIHSNKGHYKTEERYKQKYNSSTVIINEDETRNDRQVKENASSSSLSMPNCIKSDCILSTSFLRIHLFITLCFIYFIPILMSSIFYIRAVNNYKIIAEQAKVTKVIKKTNSKVDNEKNSLCEEDIQVVKEDSVHQSSWFSTEDISQQDYQNQKENSSSLPQMHDYQHFANTAYSDIFEEAERMKKLSDIYKLNLLFAVILISPMFFEILVKVFLCMHVPKWLMDSSYFSMVFFGIIRNISNLKMLNIQEAGKSTAKDNSIHPHQ